MKHTPMFALSVALLLIALSVLITEAPLPMLAQTSGFEVVQTDVGLVAATRDSTKNLHMYKMVPFAAPPIGELRWKEPQPVTPWKGVRRADWFSPKCTQPVMEKTNLLYQVDEVASEDCLYLNVWTGATTAGDKLPVVVWVYGGSNIIGSGADPRFDGAALTKKGVVIVTFNYRGGLLGWLAHPDLDKESSSQASGNYGLLDMIAALKWVQKNIAAFGGNPTNVTIVGQSAGSRDISLLTVSPLAKGLFHRVIGQSVSAMLGGFGLAGAGVSIHPKLADAEQEFDAWLKKYFKVSAIADLRKMPAWDLLKAGAPPETTIVDGYVIPDYVENIYAKGQQNDVPLLVGWNKDEGTIFAPLATKLVSYTLAAQARYGTFANQFLQTYPVKTDAEALAQSYASSRDLYGRGQWAWARAHNATGKTSAYLYYWNYEQPWLPGVKFDQADPATKLGAYVGSEISYVFRNLSVLADQSNLSGVDDKLSDTLSSYWTNFAKTGDPNGPGLPTWPVFDNKVPNPVMYLGIQVQPGPLPNKPGLDFFEAWAGSLIPVQ